MNWENKKDSPWSVILAGGEGERLRPFTERWLGRHKPKQYCTFVGSRSMFQHTVDRADQISRAERKIIIVAKEHQNEAQAQLTATKTGRVIPQPKNRDTAAGIFLALAHIKARDPNATVVLFPSDHFVYPEDRFLEIVRVAIDAAQQTQHWLFLLGVSPHRLEPDYGWVEAGRHLAWKNGHRILAAGSFVEKPTAEECRKAMAAGAYWNTLVLAARLETLWKMGWNCFPEIMSLFDAHVEAIGTSDEGSVLDAIYEVMPARNFSTHLLERTPDQVAIVEMTGVLWCDWGRPERILETLTQVGRRPAFSEAHVAG